MGQTLKGQHDMHKGLDFTLYATVVFTSFSLSPSLSPLPLLFRKDPSGRNTDPGKRKAGGRVNTAA